MSGTIVVYWAFFVLGIIVMVRFLRGSAELQQLRRQKRDPEAENGRKTKEDRYWWAIFLFFVIFAVTLWLGYSAIAGSVTPRELPNVLHDVELGGLTLFGVCLALVAYRLLRRRPQKVDAFMGLVASATLFLSAWSWYQLL